MVGGKVSHWDSGHIGPTFEVTSICESCSKCKLYLNSAQSFLEHTLANHTESGDNAV